MTHLRPERFHVRYWRIKFGLLCILLVLLAMIAYPALAAQQPACTFERVQFPVDPNMREESWPEISENGRYVAFNVIVDFPEFGGSEETFVYDRQTQELEHISVTTDEQIAYNGGDYPGAPTISPDGRFVAFVSESYDLVDFETLNYPNIYLRDREQGTTELISYTDNEQRSVGGSWMPSVSANGRFVAFVSDAPNLVAGDTNQTLDIFLRDRVKGTTERVSVASDGSQGIGEDTLSYPSMKPTVSDDGRYVVFYYPSLENDRGINVSGIFLRDREAGKTLFIAPGRNPVMSRDARYILFSSNARHLDPNDEDTEYDVILLDSQTNAFEVVSKDNEGQHNGQISDMHPDITPDGRLVVFSSYSDTLFNDENEVSDVFARDRENSTLEVLTLNDLGQQADDHSMWASVSADGRFVAFYSMATNLVENQPGTKLFICERKQALSNVLLRFYMPWISR